MLFRSEIAQSLYEKRKLITYPRTDSRHLTKELFAECLNNLRAVYPHFPEISARAAANIQARKKFDCVNDKKVTDHHAIFINISKDHALQKLAARVLVVVGQRFENRTRAFHLNIALLVFKGLLRYLFCAALPCLAVGFRLLRLRFFGFRLLGLAFFRLGLGLRLS